MGKLVTGCLDCSILHFACNLGGEIPDGLVVVGEIWMMPRVALNANSPTLLRHSKDKCPAIFRVEVGIRQHKQALVLLQLNIGFQVIKNLTSVELLHFSVGSHTCLHYLLPFKNIETPFKTVFVLIFTLVLLDANSAHSPEEYFEY